MHFDVSCVLPKSMLFGITYKKLINAITIDTRLIKVLHGYRPIGPIVNGAELNNYIITETCCNIFKNVE